MATTGIVTGRDGAVDRRQIDSVSSRAALLDDADLPLAVGVAFFLYPQPIGAGRPGRKGEEAIRAGQHSAAYRRRGHGRLQRRQRPEPIGAQ